ncbi:phosphotransferase [Novosphingobium sp. PASSN1]|uniref:phosphotransferase n=1 Tax=Novosphingobium sp. PASSN1 TaxID=2015561 RepID=UPI000BC4B752|nr:phosphotransferase [Novosphingobium sp. PASSN1]OYU34777.1 MAG: hypothetical protein CFE35_12860 [Novosphingobium sp. PASSN1]
MVETSKLPAEEQQIVAWVEQAIGAVRHIAREGRWRPSWNVDAHCDGRDIALHVRGARQGDWPPMPLSYECEVFRLFERCGVRVPHVHGFIPKLPAIVMDRAAGAPDLSRAASEADREAVRQQLIEQMLLIHRADPEGMARIGAVRPPDDDEAALSYFRLIERLFTENRVAPTPAVEFVRRWINRSIPANPDGVRPITVDAAQFIFEGDQLTAMLDFEFAGLGDYHTDLAALRIRNRAEYIGEIDDLLHAYAAASGVAPDYHRIRFHTAVIAILTPLQVARELATGPQGIDYHEYMVWNAFCVLIALDCISEMQGWDRETFEVPLPSPSRQAIPAQVLAQRLAASGSDDEFSRYQAEKSARVVGYLAKAALYQPQFDTDYLEDCAALLGVRPADWVEADHLLETRICAEDPADDEAFVRLFTRRYLRECFLLADPSDRKNHEQITTRMKPIGGQRAAG